jgi:hypothetical protein
MEGGRQEKVAWDGAHGAQNGRVPHAAGLDLLAYHPVAFQSERILGGRRGRQREYQRPKPHFRALRTIFRIQLSGKAGGPGRAI